MAATDVHTLLDAKLAGVVVVTRSDLVDDLLLPIDPLVTLTFNDSPDTEMIDSVRVGLSMLDSLRAGPSDGVLVVPADMPALTTRTCCACAEAFTANPDQIVIARHQGKRGHPIIFPMAMRTMINSLEGGLRMLPNNYNDRVLHVDVDDAGTQLDVDTPEDFERL